MKKKINRFRYVPLTVFVNFVSRADKQPTKIPIIRPPMTTIKNLTIPSTT